ncbi:sensor domain-containing diguanylate cyclase [Gracilibacillus massiliensis]|uniref:sensor domain-containing diguanylate cyclase n=1 Tax=Gracilibacillus massiliensis TaxID=1564956 RepID=UPI00071DABD1|nr:sensor domain-containing diguanylate cyclase [Gracilibacillus massiliensis]
MKRYGLLAGLFIFILSAVIIMNNRFMFVSASFLTILLSLLFIVCAFWLGYKLNQASLKISALESNETKQANTINDLTKQNQEYLQFFNCFEGVTLYIYNEKDKKTNISNGVEKLFGYTQKKFQCSTDMWKDLVHEEDRSKVKKSEQLLLTGKSIDVKFRIVHPTDGIKWIRKVSQPVTNSAGEIDIINGQFIDITEQKNLENQLRHMAYFDDLTDLPNRKMLDRHIHKALARSKRHQHSFSLMFVDLDDFKEVNDTLGHDAGDRLLKEVVARFNQTTREEDLIARIGGDEFILVFEETSREEIEDIAQRIIENTTRPYTIDENEASVSVSIGISMYPENGSDKEALIQNADKAMYFAKNNGKNNYKFYTQDMQDITLNEESIFAKWFNKIQNTFTL